MDIYAVKKSKGQYAINISPELLESNFKEEFPYEKMNELAYGITGVDKIFVDTEDNIHVNADPDDPANPNRMIVSYSFNQRGDYYTNISGIIHMGQMEPGDVYSVKSDCENEKLKMLLDKRESVYFDNERFVDFEKNIESQKKEMHIDDKKIQISDYDCSKYYLLIPYLYLLPL